MAMTCSSISMALRVGTSSESFLETYLRARILFVLLTPSALERCSDPSDWLRREIETALDNKRNIVPLILEGFDSGTPNNRQLAHRRIRNSQALSRSPRSRRLF